MPPNSLMEPVEVFFSYSHKDEKLRDALEPHLSMLQRQGVIKSWHDRKISAGTEWAGAIDDKMNSAGIILLLVSANFLASDYCYDIEMQRAMDRHEAGDARVIPIILKPVDWSGAPFAKLQAFPKDAKPVTTWSPRDKAFLDIAQGIRGAAQAMAERLRDKASTAQTNLTGLTGVQDTSLADVSQPEAAPSVTTPPALDPPEGSVSLNSPFYVERPPVESDCYATIANPGALIRIKAPRQMGKTSLMQRILHQARQQGQRTACLNFQSVDAEYLASTDLFLQWFCASITNELNLDDRLSDFWKGVLGSKNKCGNYVQRYLLPTLGEPLTLGLDEVDQVFQHLEVAQDFFGLLRAWHEKGKNEAIWQNLRLVIAHSREVYIPLNINHSPFNVGLPVDLPELTATQVTELVQRHGLNWSTRQVEQLMGMVSGHPYLVRKALYEIARGNFTLERLLQTAPTEAGLYGDHLRRHLENLHSDRQLEAAMKQIVAAAGAVRVESSVGFKLHSMGLVKLQNNDVLPLCNLYRLYFRDRLEVR